MRDEKMRDDFKIDGKPCRMCNGLKSMLLAGVLALGLCMPAALAETKTYLLHDELFSASFVTEREGWVCGDWGSILHTRDGGATWKEQPSGTVSTLSSIFFIDSLMGWSVGNEGTILHTKDGGLNWVAQKKSGFRFFHRDVFFRFI